MASAGNNSSWKQAGGFALFTIWLIGTSLALIIAMASTGANATPISTMDSHTSQINNFDYGDLISEIIDDAGNRLKKSKLHARQIKTTPRFGRRSDPLMGYGLYELQQQTLEPSDYETNQERQDKKQQRRRMIAALFNNDNDN